MSRELLWRGFPTDQRGSVFRRFWDRPGPAGTDIPPLPEWTGRLGEHLAKGAVDAVLVIRAALLRRFPKTALYLHRAMFPVGNMSTPVPMPLTSEADWAAATRQPTMRTALQPDVVLLGLPLPVGQLHSDPGTGNAGWFLVLQETAGEHRFGLPAQRDEAAPVRSWADLSWTDVTIIGGDGRLAPRHLDTEATTAALTAADSPFANVQPSWSAGSSLLAHALCRLPFRLVIHFDRLLP
jgi:hypothetical protein